MEFFEYKKLVKQVSLGKELPDAIYLHESATSYIPASLIEYIASTIKDLGLQETAWNILKLYKRDHKVALLNYPTFFDESYPALEKSLTINLENRSFRESNYAQSNNPPILHRKETFLPPNHPAIPKFSKLTKEGESAGLYKKTSIIGFKQSWERLISKNGYVLVDGRIKPKDATFEKATDLSGAKNIQIERHLTAINRDKLSAPMQLLAKHMFLNGQHSIFDYGCGKGDDVRELEAHGLDVNAWDPVYRPNGNKRMSDIVNLGFVINVIEDKSERDKTLKDAFCYCKKLLVVSAMLGSDAIIQKFKPYKDGVITARNTFQKYYTQSELRGYIETRIAEDAIAVSPGIFFIFRDKEEEQLFLSKRQKIQRFWNQLTRREKKSQAPSLKQDFIEKHDAILRDFWSACLDLGRIPANSEFEFSDRLRSLCGSHKKTFEIIAEHYDDTTFIQAATCRKNDLLSYFSLGLFSKRKPYTRMPESLKRDIKAFFGTYRNAIDEATSILFSVGKPKTIYNACYEAHQKLNRGLLSEEHSLTIYRPDLDTLPPTLRIYVGCATQLYGDIDSFDLIKIHIRSGKVTLMRFDNFSGKPIPLLMERVKINLREQYIAFFDYGDEFPPKPLYGKSIFLPPDFEGYQKQKAFDEKLMQIIPELDLSDYGPSQETFNHLLNQVGYKIKGFKLLSFH